jgi:hypothetical protein
MMLYFGVDYYPEHWPEERWQEDARLMAEASFNVVRLAEFAWSKLEPKEGHYDFAWLDRAIAKAEVKTNEWRHRAEAKWLEWRMRVACRATLWRARMAELLGRKGARDVARMSRRSPTWYSAYSRSGFAATAHDPKETQGRQ